MVGGHRRLVHRSSPERGQCKEREPKAVLAVELPPGNPVTAVCFAGVKGETAVAGTRPASSCCTTRQILKYHAQIHVRSRHGKRAAGERKISGVAYAGTGPSGDPLLLATTTTRGSDCTD